MIRLGEEKLTTSGMTVGGYRVEKTWLLKNGTTKLYVVLGLLKDATNKSHGWATLTSTHLLSESRRFVEEC